MYVSYELHHFSGSGVVIKHLLTKYVQVAGAGPCARAAYVQANPGVFMSFSTDITPLLLQVYNAAVTPDVRLPF